MRLTLLVLAVAATAAGCGSQSSTSPPPPSTTSPPPAVRGAIAVDSPAAGATVGSTIAVRGTAEVFEGTLTVQLVRGGAVLARRTVTASAGAPERGTFATTLHAPSAGPATVQVFAPSAADGSHQHEVDVPVDVGP